MYCVPIKTGIKTNNPHIFPVHQKAKKRARKKIKKWRERTNSKAFMHAILSPHHFISSTTRGEGCVTSVTRTRTYC
ncbi:hypothetical protein ACN38_g9066 [Penicillium nordicum]|uniref:Uncharacterized protein n=1 Tax=Penicillium nordicum TaxID=229535 RepID=A0A0M8P498_9EURO|nr:hypothetical protein ACN38_g9066 [Penicillium nordicum]